MDSVWTHPSPACTRQDAVWATEERLPVLVVEFNNPAGGKAVWDCGAKLVPILPPEEPRAKLRDP